MKKLITLLVVAFIAAIVLPSCKKDWTCVCTDSSGQTSSYPIENSRKPDAKLICDAFGTTDCELQ